MISKMNKIVVKKWNFGFNKVQFTKLQYNLLGLDLKVAKKNTDDILENKIVSIEIKNDDLLHEFVTEAVNLGVEIDVVKDYSI